MKIIDGKPTNELNLYCSHYLPNATKLHVDKSCLQTYQNILIEY